MSSAPATRERAATRGESGALAVPRSTDLISALRAAWRTTLWPLIPVAIAILVWAFSLDDVNIRHMTDLGLVSVFPVSIYVALGILTFSFCFAIRRPGTHWLVPALHVIALIVIIHGTPAILYGTLRYSWAWKHVGIVDYIQRHGSVDPNITVLQANHLWPGFFALGALLTDVAGFKSALSYASWAPVFFNLLFAGALLFVFRSLTTDMRLAWLAVWLFVATNWVGQDYFSPQAMNYFLYLVIVGICLRWFRPFVSPYALGRLVGAASGNGEQSPRPDLGARIKRRLVPDRPMAFFQRMVDSGAADIRGVDPIRRRQRPALLLIVVALCAVVVVSHQLTPFMLIFALTALVGFQVCGARTLPLLVIVFTAAWTAYMGVGFLNGNFYWIVESIGKLNVGSSTLANLAQASKDQVFIAHVSRGLSGLVVVLALVGFIRRIRTGPLDLPVVLLAVVPAFMVWGNAYGGEILFRVYLFSLPFLAFLGAAALYPRVWSGKSRALPLLAAAMSAVLLTGLYFAYYGKERAYHFTRDEVTAANYLFTKAPAGSVFVDGMENYPWAFRNYERYRYLQIALQPAADRKRILDSPAAGIRWLVSHNGGGRAYLIITRSQEAQAEMTGVLLSDSLERIKRAAMQSPDYRVVYRGPDAVIFALTPVKAAS
jgi:hypothetical protein